MDINVSPFTKACRSLWPHQELPLRSWRQSAWFLQHPNVVSRKYERVCVTQLEVNGNPRVFELGPRWRLLMWDGQIVNTKWVNHLISPPVFTHLELSKCLSSLFIPLLSASHAHACKTSHFIVPPAAPPLALRCVCVQTDWSKMAATEPDPSPRVPRAPWFSRV